MAKKRASRKARRATSSHGKPVADSHIFKASDPATPPLTDEIPLAEIFAKALRSLSPEEQIKGISVDPTFLVNYTTAVVLLAVEATSKRLCQREMQAMSDEVESSRRLIESKIDDIISSAAAFSEKIEGRAMEWPTDYRSELIEQTLSGSTTEVIAFQTAANIGSLQCFFASKKLPDYDKARNSVNKAEQARPRLAPMALTKAETLWASIKTMKSASSLTRQPLSLSTDTKALNAISKSYHNQWFAAGMPDALLCYWLPLALWTLPTGEALQKLAKTFPAMIASSEEMMSHYARWMAEIVGTSGVELSKQLHSAKFSQFTPGNYDTTVSRLKLYRQRATTDEQPEERETVSSRKPKF